VSRLAGSPAGWWLTGLSGAFAVAVAAGFALRLPLAAAFAPPAVGIAAALVVAPRGGRAAAALILGAALVLTGVLRGSVAVRQPGPGHLSGHLGNRPVVLTGVVRAGGSRGTDAVVDVGRVSDADADVAVSGGLLIIGTSLPALQTGDRVEVDAPGIRPPSRRPGPRSEAALEREGVEALATAAQVTVLAPAGPSPAGALAWMQARLVSAVNAVLPEPEAGLLLGIAFGIRRPISAATRAPLQATGLVHIVVVSGLKVVLLVGMIATVARALEWSRRRTLVMTAAIVTAYVLVSGAGPAAVRSAVMAAAALLARAGARRVDPLPLLALVAAVMLAIAPPLAEDPGFQLSFLGTAGILVLAEPLAKRIPGPRVLAEPFAVTVAAQLATVPVMAGTFGVISLVGPLANALVLPLLPGLILLGGLGAGLSAVLPALGWLPLQIAGAGTVLIQAIAASLSALPGAAIHVGTWPLSWSIAELAGLSAGAAILVARRRAGLGLRRGSIAAASAIGLLTATCSAAVAAAPDRLLHVTVLDVGAAPAVLAQSESGALALIDGGSSPAALLQALGRLLPPWTKHLDLVVVTGGDRAAIEGLQALAGQYTVGSVVVPAPLAAGPRALIAALQSDGAEVIVSGGRSWTWGGSIWRCFAYTGFRTAQPECAVGIIDRTGRALVLGVAGSGDQEEIAGLYGGELAADLVVAPPGGALAPALLAAARPSAVAIPAATGSATLPSLGGYAVRHTAADGDIAFAGGPLGLEAAD
jgi:competence protein ComEC